MLLALDLATCVGWCKGDGTRIPMYGSLRLPSTGDNVGQFLSAWRKELIELLQGTTKVIFEAPILPKTTSMKTVTKLHSMAGLTELACYNMQIPCFSVQPMSVKKNWLGKVPNTRGMKPHEKKAPMIQRAKDLGFDPQDSDTADAIAIWFFLMTKKKGPEACEAFEKGWHMDGSQS